MPGLPLRPIITYDTPSKIIDLSMPQKWWGYKTQLKGGSRTSSAGIPESFVIREDNMSMLTLRVHECELMDVRAWIVDFWRRNQPFDFQYDALDPLTKFTAYLDAPTFDDGWEPRRMTNPNFPQFWEVDVTIRNVVQVPIFVSVTGDCASTSVQQMDWVISQLDASALPFGGGRKILSLSAVAPIFPPDGTVDPSALDGSDFTPAGWDALGTYTSINPIQEWITRPLSAGYVIPSVAQIGGATSGSPAADWYLQDVVMYLQHLRGGVSIASSDAQIASFGWLGGGDYTVVNFSSIGVLKVDDDDQLLLRGFSRYSPRPGGDHSGRVSLSYGSVFGPLTTTRLYGSGNVTELS